MDIDDSLFPKLSESLQLSKDKCFICKEQYDFIGEKIIWGNGNKIGCIMVIGKDSAMPKNEPIDKLWTGSCKTGMPLTNLATGKRFRNFLKNAGFNLTDVFFTNCVKCNDSSKSKILNAFKDKTIFRKLSKKCIFYLEKEISRVRPRIIMTLGDAFIPVKAMLIEDEILPNISGIELSEFMQRKHPLKGKFENGVKSKIFYLKHPSWINGGKRQENYLKNLRIIANSIGV